MESKIQIDINAQRKEHLTVKYIPSEDLRDKLLGMFLNTAIPMGVGILDGYCRISVLEYTGSLVTVQIIPMHPSDVPKHIPLIEENATKFNNIA